MNLPVNTNQAKSVEELRNLANRMTTPTIGQAIRAAINRSPLNRTEAAGAIGVSRMTLNRWERDEGSPPRYDQLAALGKAIGIRLIDTPTQIIRRVERAKPRTGTPGHQASR